MPNRVDERGRIFMDARDGILFFLKFQCREYLEDLQKGILYMKNFKYYKDLEKKDKQKGKGDITEASQFLKDVDFRLIDRDTNKTFIVGKAGSSLIENEDDKLKPVFCLSQVDINSLTNIQKDNDFITGDLIFSEKDKERILKELGESVLIISPYHFVNNLKSKFKEKDLEYADGKVEYDDFNINNYERLLDYINGKSERFFWKDTSYDYQKEYRFVVLNRNVDDHLIINLDDMSDYSRIMDAEKLLNGKFQIKIKTKSIKI